MAGNDDSIETARDMEVLTAKLLQLNFAYRNRLKQEVIQDDTNEVFSLHGDLA